MKLLFYRYGSICEPDIIEGFEELGHTVYQMTEEMQNKSLMPQESIRLVSDSLFQHPVDFIFSINFFPFLSEVCNIFKIPYLCWTVDSPVMELYATSITNPWNRIFLFDRAQYDEFAPLNPGHIFHLPLAVNIRQKQDAISHATDNMHAKYSSDISFVGSLYTEKCPFDRLENPPAYLSGFLNGIIEAQLRIYGGYIVEDLLTDEIVTSFKEHLPGFYQYPYDSYLTDKKTVAQLYIGNKISAVERMRIMDLLSRRFSVDLYTASDTSDLPYIHNRGLAKTLSEMPVIFHDSKINLNITSKAIRSGLPLRIFDILGCGGFVLTNFQTELPEYFIPGEDLVCYENLDDLSDKVEYYLNHEKERQEIAENGFQKASSFHTYTIRLSQMISLAFS